VLIIGRATNPQMIDGELLLVPWKSIFMHLCLLSNKEGIILAGFCAEKENPNSAPHDLQVFHQAGTPIIILLSNDHAV